MKKTMNVATVVSNEYLKYMVVALKALLENNKSHFIKMYIYVWHIEKENQEMIERLFAEYDADVEFYMIPKDGTGFMTWDEFPNSNNVPIQIYTENNLQYMLPKEMDRVLFIESDVLITKDLSEFYEMDFEDTYMIGTPSTINIDDNDFKNGSIVTSRYKVNSGTLLLNLKKLREVKKEEFLKYSDYTFKLCVEDLMNVMYSGKIKFVPAEIYNNRRVHQFTEDTVIYHYTSIKPWEIWPYADLSKLYDKESFVKLAFKGELPSYIEKIKIWWEYAKKVENYESLKEESELRTDHMLNDSISKTTRWYADTYIEKYNGLVETIKQIPGIFEKCCNTLKKKGGGLAICGMGYIGELFYEECLKQGISVKYYIGKSPIKNKTLEYRRYEEVKNDVDLVVVCLTEGVEEVKENIRKNSDVKILHLTEIKDENL